MDIFIAVFGSLILFLTFITVMAMIDSAKTTRSGLEYIKYPLILIPTLIGLLIWDYQAASAHASDPANITKISCPIQSAFHTAFYVDEDGKPHEILGDAKFADPAVSEMVITKTKGGWKWGIYVTESRSVKLEKKALPEAQK